MLPSPIYTSEPMVTRALAAEVRHYAGELQSLLENRSGGRTFGTLRRVRCEANARLDVLLEFEQSDGTSFSVGLEAKFDHELTRAQILREVEAVQQLFVVVLDTDGIPHWLAKDFPSVSVLSWSDVLRCFPDSRITENDLDSIRTLKAAVEVHFRRLEPKLERKLDGWDVETRRNQNNNPSIVFESPALPDGRTLRGQIQVPGRGMPQYAEEVRLESHMGISVVEDDSNYFDPSLSPAVPAWVESLRTLQREVLDGNEDRLRINREPPGHSPRKLGRWKKPLALRHLKEDAHLAKGFVTWAIGPKTTTVPLEQLDELAAITVKIFEQWFVAEHTDQRDRATSKRETHATN